MVRSQNTNSFRLDSDYIFFYRSNHFHFDNNLKKKNKFSSSRGKIIYNCKNEPWLTRARVRKRRRVAEIFLENKTGYLFLHFSQQFKHCRCTPSFTGYVSSRGWSRFNPRNVHFIRNLVVPPFEHKYKCVYISIVANKNFRG